MADEVFEGFQEQSGEGLLIGLGDVKHPARGLQRFFPERVADFGEDKLGGGGGVEAEFQGHGKWGSGG